MQERDFSADYVRSLIERDKRAFINALSLDEVEDLEYDALFWLRKKQRPPPGDWNQWAVIAGRGFGKTYTGNQFIRLNVEGDTPLGAGKCSNVAIIAETAADARDVLVEGPAGILALSPKDYRPLYEPSKRRLTWPNGAIGILFNATEPDQLRGPQHDLALCDEFAKWKYARETWDMLQFGLRLGTHPRAAITTTPRPIAVLKEILRDPKTVTTRGSTYENEVNLARTFLETIRRKYAGSRLGRQEIEAEILDDTPGALWNLQMIEAARLMPDMAPGREDLARRVVAIDPPATSGENADECGIMVASRSRHKTPRFYVEDDLSIPYAAPGDWGRIVVDAYHTRQCDRVIAESNNGGEMITHVINSIDPTVPVTLVHASKGKYIRAEPISTLYEQGRVSHIGAFPELESQMCVMTPDFDRKTAGYSPDRVDALVWALTDLSTVPTDLGIEV